MAIPDNKSGREGCYCSLVQSKTVDGKYVHEIVLKFGFIPYDRVPFLKAVYAKGDPDATVAKEKALMERKRDKHCSPKGVSEDQE